MHPTHVIVLHTGWGYPVWNKPRLITRNGSWWVTAGISEFPLEHVRTIVGLLY